MENDVDGNGIGIQTVDSGRVDEQGPVFKTLWRALPYGSIRKKPPQELEKMGAGNVRDSVPTDEPGLCTFRIFYEQTIYVFNVLGKQMDPPTVLRRQPFDLFDDAKLSTMATI